MRHLALAALFTTGALFSPPTAATPHFDDCQTMTGNNATFIVPEEALTTSAIPVSVGSELALFTPEGICAGYAQWDGEALAIALWEDNPLTGTQDGFLPGDPLRLAVWDAGSETEYAEVPVSLAPIYNDESSFASDAVYLVDALGATTGTADDASEAVVFELQPNYPNPFVKTTTIAYTVPEPTAVRLDVYDLLGQHIAELVDETQSPGTYDVTFRPDASLASGTYLYRLVTDRYAEVHRMTIVR